MNINKEGKSLQIRLREQCVFCFVWLNWYWESPTRYAISLQPEIPSLRQGRSRIVDDEEIAVISPGPAPHKYPGFSSPSTLRVDLNPLKKKSTRS